MSTSARTTIRWIVLGLLVLIAALQLTLWTGPGGMPDAWRLRERVVDQAEENRQLLRRNQDLGADVQDLTEGREAVEERARAELAWSSRARSSTRWWSPAPAPRRPRRRRRRPTRIRKRPEGVLPSVVARRGLRIGWDRARSHARSP